MKKILVLFNPSSAGGRSVKKRYRIEKKFINHGVPYDLRVTGSENELKMLACEGAESGRNIIAVGGDTTFTIVASEILKKKMGNKIKLGMIGTGSINDIVRGIDLENIDKMLKAVEAGESKKIDVGQVKINPSGKIHYFLGTLGAGLASIVNRYIEQMKINKNLITKVKPAMELTGFVSSVKKSFAQNEVPIKINIKYNNTDHEKEFTLLLFQNTPLYSRGMRLSPDASPYDNILDCSVIKTSSLTNTISLAVSAFRGKHTNRKELEVLRSVEFYATTEKEIDIVADGEIIEDVKDFHVSLLKEGLNIFYPVE
ncbi:MAG: diacylglycerol kinase family protein [Acidobacteriota bacterium]